MTTLSNATLRKLALSTSLLAACALPVLAAHPARAQETAEPAEAEQPAAEGDQSIVVTGSRVARAGYEAPTPTTVVGTELLQTTGASQVADVLNAMPSFKGSYTAANTGPRSFGNPGGSFADLRSLNAIRTLTLIDSRRVVPASILAQVDLNIVPTVLIDHVDVVTGGASAAYGSDAVAGVVNVLLNHRLEGLKGDVGGQISSQGDAEEWRIGLAGGLTFADGRAHVLVGGEYVNNKGAGNAYSRDWGRKEYGLLVNPCREGTPVSAACPTGWNGLAAQLIVPNYRASNIDPGGLVVSGPLRGLAFVKGGQTRQFQYGTLVNSTFMTGGDGYGRNYAPGLLLAPLERYNILGRLDYEFADTLKVFVEAAYADALTDTRGAQARDVNAFTVFRENPFLPASVRQQMINLGLNTLSVGRNNFDFGFSRIISDTAVQRYVLGLNGNLGGGWSWDAYAQYGRTNHVEDLRNVRITANWNRAIDAVTDPATGNIVCRSTLLNPTNGCVPANIFGDGSPSQAAIDYVNGDAHYKLIYEQTVLAASLSGTPFATWAGDVSVAAGFEFRKEEAEGVSDPISQAGGFNFGNSKAIDGEINVKEGFLEVVVPLLKDAPFANLLELNGAVRLTDYSTSGSVTTWKGGLNLEVSDDIRFRATRSRDIRAANMAELYTDARQSNQTVFNPIKNETILATPTLTSGNVDLRPERADTLTAGVVLSPRFIPRLNLSVDYYNVKIKDAITNLTFQQIVNLCLVDNNQAFCPFVIRNGTGTITTVLVPTVNIASISTSGVDIEASYRIPFNLGSMTSGLGFRFFASYVDHLTFRSNNTVSEGVGNLGTSLTTTNNQPKWRFSLLTTFDAGPASVTATLRYISGGKYSTDFYELDEPRPAGAVTVNDNTLPAVAYVDLSARYEIIKRGRNSVELYGSIINLFDKDPPPSPNQTFPANTAIYDTVGRLFRAGVRFAF